MRELNIQEIGIIVGAGAESTVQASWTASVFSASATVGNFVSNILGSGFFNQQDVAIVASSLFMNTVGAAVSFVGALVDQYIPDCIINIFSGIWNVVSGIVEIGVNLINSLFGNN